MAQRLGNFFWLLLLKRLRVAVYLLRVFLSHAIAPRSCGIGLGPGNEVGIIDRKMQGVTRRTERSPEFKRPQSLRKGKPTLIPQKYD